MYFDLSVMLCALSGVIAGAKILKNGKPLYAQMIVMGMGCMAMGKAYCFARQLTDLPMKGIFHVGILGIVGAFGFFFSSNFGQIDSLVDEGGKSFIKYRIISLSAVAVIAAFYAVILLSSAKTVEKITDALAAIAIAAACYYHLKHLLIPDIENGIVKSLRGYNALALAYGVVCMLGIAASAFELETVYGTACILQCAVSLMIVPIMKKGVSKWSK